VGVRGDGAQDRSHSGRAEIDRAIYIIRSPIYVGFRFLFLLHLTRRHERRRPPPRLPVGRPPTSSRTAATRPWPCLASSPARPTQPLPVHPTRPRSVLYHRCSPHTIWHTLNSAATHPSCPSRCHAAHRPRPLPIPPPGHSFVHFHILLVLSSPALCVQPSSSTPTPVLVCPSSITCDGFASPP